MKLPRFQFGLRTLLIEVSLFTACSATGLLLFKHGWPRFVEGLKGGDGWLSLAIVPTVGAALYGVSFLVWLFIVTRLPLTIAYPVAIGLSLIAVTIGSVAWLGEPLSAIRIIGALLVVAGITLIVK